jgi:hypothetical protein
MVLRKATITMVSVLALTVMFFAGATNTGVAGKASAATSGRVITVSSTLQAAVNSAASGDTIYVPAGTWSGSTSISGKSNLTIYGAGASSVVGVLDIIGGSNIVIHDLTIKDSYSNNWVPGICISNSLAGGHFYNLTFVGMGHSCINAAGPVGSWTAVITNIEVDHCTAAGPIGEYGFYVGRGCSNWNLHDNSIGQCVGKTTPPHQFYIQDSIHITVANNYSYGTTASNGFAYKAAVGDSGQGHSYDIQFTNNKSSGCYGGLWLVATKDVTASGNQFLSCTNQGVQFWANNSNITLENNAISSSLYGITFATDGTWSSGVHLRNNTVTAPVQFSLGGGPSSMIAESSGNSWEGNTIANQTTTTTRATTTTTKATTTTTQPSTTTTRPSTTTTQQSTTTTSRAATTTTRPSTTTSQWPSWLRYDETDGHIVYSGRWSSYVNDVFSGRSYRYSDTPGSTVTLTFNGRALKWVGTKGPIYGKASISVDGKTPVTLDLYAPTMMYRQVVWSTGTLSDGAHTVRITCSGSKNTYSQGTYINVDAILVAGTLR